MTNLISRTKPCSPYINEAEVDPWLENPPIKSVISNYTIYKCQDSFKAGKVGLASFVNLTIADYAVSGFRV